MAISQAIEPVHNLSESVPLHPGRPLKKPFYRARPLWLVPFAVVASLIRGMTLAPRVEVFTQLSCNNLYGHHKWNYTQSAANFSFDIAMLPFHASLDSLGPHFHPYTLSAELGIAFANNQLVTMDDDSDSDDTDDPRRIPSSRCSSDPAVQAGAARLQTIMTTTMGLLSALTTGWWGNFGQRHGRTRVLALTTLGLFLTDLIFILVSTPSSPLSRHGHVLLLLSPIIEGLMGGYSTLQSAISAYLSDCTSSGSRAQIFARFTGVMYIGFTMGPILGGWLIRHPIWIEDSSIPGRQSVTSVFWVAIFCSFINFLSMAFVFPESLDKQKREWGKEKALTLSSDDPSSSSTDEDNIEKEEGRQSGLQSGVAGIIGHFLSPLAVFLPVVVFDSSGLGRKRRDWSLTLVAMALFGYMLSAGVIQIKYLYARNTFKWGAEQLSYYISFLGGSGAVFLLFLFPAFISFIKPKPLPPSQRSQPEQQPLQKGENPKPTRAQLGQGIGFDLLLTRLSLITDIFAQTLIILFSAPAAMATGQTSSPAMFVVASALGSMGTGAVPSFQSLALCILQVRSLDAADSDDGGATEPREEKTGALFGAFAVLQTIGETILGPMIFGLVYSGTVAKFSAAIFMVSIACLVCSLAVVLSVRNPVQPTYSEPSSGKKNGKGRDIEKGRFKVRGGVFVNYGSDGSCVNSP